MASALSQPLTGHPSIRSAKKDISHNSACMCPYACSLHSRKFPPPPLLLQSHQPSLFLTNCPSIWHAQTTASTTCFLSTCFRAARLTGLWRKREVSDVRIAAVRADALGLVWLAGSAHFELFDSLSCVHVWSQLLVTLLHKLNCSTLSLSCPILSGPAPLPNKRSSSQPTNQPYTKHA
ncbi:hypothetical protein BKA81DRAFT_359183 [Phyllosticta paracitricarpa]